MSDSDSVVSSAVPAPAETGEASALVSIAAVADTSDDAWSAWDLAGADPQPSDWGVDQVIAEADGGDWFPSAPAFGVVAAALAADADSDPLVHLPPSDFIQIAESLEDVDAGFPPSDADGGEQMVAWEALHHPIDHSLPLDHVDWHLGGLLS